MSAEENKPPHAYYARDRRSGSEDMQKERDHIEALNARMKTANPEAYCMYYPVEQKFKVFVGFPEYYALTGRSHDCEQKALIEAINVFEVNP